MKYIIPILAILVSCNSVANEPAVTTKANEPMQQQGDYKKMISKNSTYTLHYKVKEDMTSPVKLFTYYVTSTTNNKTIRSSETVAAEKIYWKDDHTLAIIPYTEVMQQSTEVGADPKPKEILINIK